MELNLLASLEVEEGARLRKAVEDGSGNPTLKAEFHDIAERRLRVLSGIAACNNAEVVHMGKNARGVLGYVDLRADQFTLRVCQNMAGRLGLILWKAKSFDGPRFDEQPLPADLLDSFDSLKERLIAEGVIESPEVIH